MLSLGNLRLRATWSQGFKTPTLKEMNYCYIREMNSIIMYLGNKDLKPQTSNYYSVNVEYTHRGFNLTATAYLNRVDNMIALATIDQSSAPLPYRQQYGEMLSKVRQYQNMEDARTSGFDVSLRYTRRQWTAGASYSYLDTDAHVYDADHDCLSRVVIDGSAYHKGSLFATWEHRFTPHYQLGLGLYGRFSSKRYYQIDGNGKAFQIWRLTTTHTLGNSRHASYRLEAGIDNIFNYVDRTPHGLHLGTTTPGTTVYATLSISFSQGQIIKLNHKTKSNLKQSNNEED